MAAGLKVWDASGNLVLDSADRLLRFLGTAIVGPGPVSGSITNDGFLTGEPHCFCTMHSNNALSFWPGEGMLAPSISFVGNVMVYTLTAAHPTTRLQYVVY